MGSDHPMRKFVFKNYKELEFFEKIQLNNFLNKSPKLKALYYAKTHLQRMYDTKAPKYAELSMNSLISNLSQSTYSVCQRLGRTLSNWKNEILNYFQSRLTNARVEGFNNKAKLIKRRAFGYRSFKNYRLRLLNACC